ncbi:MAG: PHP domain-containing protein [Candidatus Abyssobacteria bacterium SURF_17]|jgi:predicted metal-dependent phosphoesterase TrpH|uniref:PHP domain-containing protein n=1 Tax=Candidatus Abyssobacteria bacterium SURF_17 TaxID=2093361 RepID=A0A419ES23_9BACT|nr:MAG: PHP domain-containing protein [Candidatus Abyssubacteria bacterium SURF_17]
MEEHLRFDLHVHTTRGSDCSILAPDDLIKRAALLGLAGVCITEHDHLSRSPELEGLAHEKGLLLFYGIEANTDCGEVLAFGPKKYVEGFHKLQNLRRAVDHEGGIIVAAHPFRQVFSPFYAHRRTPRLTLQDAVRWPVMEQVDALEVVNGASTVEEAAFARSVSKELGLGMTGGSDAHSVEAIGMCVTVFERAVSGWTEFLQELRAGRYHPQDLRTVLPPPR